jgi:hypothetical protein
MARKEQKLGTMTSKELGIFLCPKRKSNFFYGQKGICPKETEGVHVITCALVVPEEDIAPHILSKYCKI